MQTDKLKMLQRKARRKTDTYFLLAKGWRTHYDLLFVEFTKLPTLLTVPLFLLCQSMPSGKGLCPRRRASHLSSSSLLTFELHPLARRPFSPCKSNLELVRSSSVMDLGASGWCCLTLEKSGYFAMPGRSELWWSTLVVRKVNSPSYKFKFSIVVLVEILLQTVLVLNKPMKHTELIPIFEDLGSLPKEGSFLCFLLLQELLQFTDCRSYYHHM